MPRFLRSFRQLRWKLTLFYALTGVASFVLLVALGFGSGLLYLGTHVPEQILGKLNSQAVQGAPYLAQARQNPALLAAWLQITTDDDASQNADNDPFHFYPIFFSVVDEQGAVLTSTGSQALAPGTLMLGRLTMQNAAHLLVVLGDRTGATSTANADTQGTMVTISPLVVHGRTQGALVLKIVQPDVRVLFF